VSGSTACPRWSAVDLAKALGQSHAPTAEQVRVIEASPDRPLLVVAGAGSGKTETMAARVVWLVANDLVRPDEVLGLTFTRKAAGELGERLAGRLATLREVGLWTPREDSGVSVLDDGPTVSTYHAYAGAIVREHGPRLGVEAESRLLTEAAAWQYAHEAVTSWVDDVDGVDKAESTVTTALVDLAGEMAEHLVDVHSLAAHLDEVVATLEALPKGATRKRTNPAETLGILPVLRDRRAILPLVERYAELKRTRDAMDFADQMALAARVSAAVPAVGRAERARYRAVLLDEFQDTSEAQLQLLRTLFVAEGEPVRVTAVGDPHQSIYGWRGASSTTLSQFRTRFGDPEPARVEQLSTSWRNDEAVLAAANHVAGPLREQSHVPVVSLRARHGAGPGRVDAARVETVEDEAALVADWLVRRGAGRDGTTASVLCRRRSQFLPVVEALERSGLPYEVVGLGGLLHTPEVADLVALLWVVADPTRGDHLMRLLTGPSCRLGIADLDGLAEWARLRQRDARSSSSGPRRDDLAPDSSERTSIVEALDDLPPSEWSGEQGQRVSDAALDRLAGLAVAVRRLRSLTGLGLAELAVEAEAALGLDVEVLARPGWTPGAARAHLDAFADVAAGFSASADRDSLGGFLAWLDAAVAEERGLDLGWVETRPDAVQVMTVHAAKGLEWDLVAVPGLVEATFPAHSGVTKVGDDGEWTHGEPKDKGWLVGLDALPYDLRGDAAGLPHLPWRSVADWDGLAAAHERFLREGAAHGILEERRLAYVALTRARRDLLLAAHVWGDRTTPRLTSRFLHEVRDAGLVVGQGPWVPMPPVDPAPQNPRTVEPVVAGWPEPLRADRVARLAGPAAEVASAAAGVRRDPSSPAAASRWNIETGVLLAERDRRRRPGATEVALPSHLSASALVSLADDPAAFTAALRRPMPAAPARAARRGTAFHAWVEERYARAAIVDVDELPGSADDGAGDDDLDALRAAFEASEWAGRTPIEVETSVETVVDGVAVRGRIDAVFEDTGADGEPVWTVVDWKTGAPATGSHAGARALQLGTYRLAWARARGVDPDRVRGAFFHASTGQTLWPDLPAEEDLSRVLGAARPR
jgi:DNA helicase-2/ATP-dependent DNA helicase PcrA